MNLNVRLAVQGFELEDRIQPAVGPSLKNLLSHGAAAQLGSVSTQVKSVLNSVKPAKGGQGNTDTATASVSGSAFTDWNQNGLRDAGDDADTGVTVTLSGTDNLGNAVSLTVNVDENGNYSFTGLRAGTYSLTFSSSSSSGAATVGSAGGSPNSESASTIDGIVLTNNTQASNYNFAVAPMAS